MNSSRLLLYSRNGCCICEGLEEKLRMLPLDELSPSLELQVIDIDEEEIPEDLRARYDLEVPVLALDAINHHSQIDLPRVSPRLKGEGLLRWLKKVCANAIEAR